MNGSISGPFLLYFANLYCFHTETSYYYMFTINYFGFTVHFSRQPLLILIKFHIFALSTQN